MLFREAYRATPLRRVLYHTNGLAPDGAPARSRCLRTNDPSSAKAPSAALHFSCAFVSLTSAEEHPARVPCLEIDSPARQAPRQAPRAAVFGLDYLHIACPTRQDAAHIRPPAASGTCVVPARLSRPHACGSCGL